MFTTLALLFAAKVAATSSLKATIRGTDEPLQVTVLRRDAGNAWQQIANRQLPASQRRLDFNGLVAGIYQLRVQGAGVGEQAAAKVIVGTGERRSTTIDIDPIEIFGRVTLGDIPLAGAVIALQQGELRLQTAMIAGDDGLFHARLWQRGAFNYVVRSEALATSYSDHVTIDGALPFRWEIHLPDRRIIGVVRDRVTGAAVPAATLHVDTSSGETKRHLNAHAGSDGRFDLAAMHAGLVTISANADGYIEGSSAPFELGQADRMQEIAIALQPGVLVPLTVNDGTGRPLADALVLTVIGGKIRAHTTTGSDGRAHVTLPRDAAATLYAIPRDGSFAIAHVTKAEEAPRRLTLPRPSSTLRIVARTTDGKALPDVTLLMRVDGELIPPAVADVLTDRQGFALRTDEHGEVLLRKLPAGSYEFWPYSGESEAEAIVETAASVLAPIVVNVKTGENTIAVNFRAH